MCRYPFESYANTAATVQVINANLGAFQTFANANACGLATSINTINANVGAYQTYGNVTFSTVANAATQAGQIQTLNANVGAFETWANATFLTSDIDSYSNANVASYLPTYSGNVTAANISLTGNTGHPTNISTIVSWARVTVGGVAFWTPLYQ